MESTEKKVIKICKSSIEASQNLNKIKNSDRNRALKLIAKKILVNKDYILKQNKKDIREAKKSGLSKPLIDNSFLMKKVGKFI